MFLFAKESLTIITKSIEITHCSNTHTKTHTHTHTHTYAHTPTNIYTHRSMQTFIYAESFKEYKNMDEILKVPIVPNENESKVRKLTE